MSVKSSAQKYGNNITVQNIWAKHFNTMLSYMTISQYSAMVYDNMSVQNYCTEIIFLCGIMYRDYFTVCN